MPRTHVPYMAVLPVAMIGVLWAMAVSADVRPEVLLDRAPGTEGIARYDGTPNAPGGDVRAWRQLHHALRAAHSRPESWPELWQVERMVRDTRPSGIVPIGLLDVRYERSKPGVARAPGNRSGLAPEDVTRGRVFSAATLVARTHRGASVRFQLDSRFVFRHATPGLRDVRIDFGDGLGLVTMHLDTPHRVTYASAGTKSLRLHASDASGASLEAVFRFEVASLTAPSPDDTLRVTGTIPFAGGVASGEAYVYLAPGHSDIVNPIVVAEGFDLDNSLYWDEIYELLNRQNLVETLRAEGYDLVVLNFDDATDYVQRNAYTLMELLQQVRVIAGGTNDMVVIGASMGGLCARLALATLEDLGVDHGCRLFISFDTPHAGANIPLGVQHWVDFFAGQSAEAQLLLDALNSPAARQQLVYHHLASTTGGVPDPLRGGLIGDLSAVGDYPAMPRIVAVANGSGQQADQGFAPGAQIVEWDYNTVLVDIIGNVWATPNGGPGTVFQGDLFIFLVANVSETITVSGTLPWDGAPGGHRNSMAEMDSVMAPFGDIVALHPNHCFIPTISALDLAVTDPFYDIAGEPNLLPLTPFDAVYFPAANQEHVSIVAENATWLLDEIGPLTVSVEAPALTRPLERLSGAPNPFASHTRLRFRLASTADVDLRIYGVDGREIARLWRGTLSAGTHTRTWDGRDATGRLVPPGLYFAQFTEGGRSHTLRLVRMQ